MSQPIVGRAIAANQFAAAETAAEAARRWGLLGVWRWNCSEPASRSNGSLKYAVRGGQLFHDRNFGDASDSHPVQTATIGPDGSFYMVVTFTSLSQTRQWGMIKGGDGRIRTMWNRNVDTDVYSVRDGLLTANGKPTPWQTRCGE